MSLTQLLESTNFDYSQFRICLMIFVSNTVGYMRITGVLLQIVVRQLRLLLKGWDRVASLTTLAYRLEGHEPSLSYDRHPELMENISACFEVYAE
jgi:hypothetical protein